MLKEKVMNMPRFLLWLVTIVVLCGPPLLLAVKPETYTPVLAAVLSGVLFALSRMIGLEQATDRAVKKANERWLPGSESAINRLLTVLNSVERFKCELSGTCKTVAREFPDLEDEKNKVIKILFNTHCRHGESRLCDIINHLEDAQADWSRFLQANCQGEDCTRIFRSLKERKNLLERQLKNEFSNTGCSKSTDPILDAGTDDSQQYLRT